MTDYEKYDLLTALYMLYARSTFLHELLIQAEKDGNKMKCYRLSGMLHERASCIHTLVEFMKQYGDREMLEKVEAYTRNHAEEAAKLMK